MPRRATRITLADVWQEFRKGRIFEVSIRHDRTRPQFEGLQSGENIYIDPRVSVLDTVIHECLHRKYPRWGEKRVLVETDRLIHLLTEADKRRWWTAYNRTKRRARPVDPNE